MRNGRCLAKDGVTGSCKGNLRERNSRPKGSVGESEGVLGIESEEKRLRLWNTKKLSPDRLLAIADVWELKR